MSPRLALLGASLLIAALALVASGCGGARGSASFQDQSLTKAEFGKKMFPLCKPLKKAFDRLGKARSARSVLADLPQAIEAGKNLLDRLAKQRPPVEIEPYVADYLSTLGAEIGLMEKWRAAGKNGTAAFLKEYRKVNSHYVTEVNMRTFADAILIGAVPITMRLKDSPC